MGRKDLKTNDPGSKERILQAAVELFSRRGYGNTGLRELAALADVNLAMINYFYGSKKALLKEILDMFFSGYLEIARSELLGNAPPLTRLDKFIHKVVTFFSENSEYLLVTITELPHEDPEITEHKALWGKQMIATVKEFLDSVDLDSEIAELAVPVLFCSTLTSMMASKFLFNPVMAQVQPERLASVTLDDYADLVSKIFLQGLGSFIKID